MKDPSCGLPTLPSDEQLEDVMEDTHYCDQSHGEYDSDQGISSSPAIGLPDHLKSQCTEEGQLCVIVFLSSANNPFFKDETEVLGKVASKW